MHNVTFEVPVKGCFLCMGNDQLAFTPIRAPHIPGYIIPGSMPVVVDGATVLVPLPFSHLLVSSRHPRQDYSGGYGYAFPTNWSATRQYLLPFVPDLRPGDPWSIVTQFGYEAGSRVAPHETPNGQAPAHPFEWIIVGRDKIPESPATSTLGLATILYNSRVDSDMVLSPAELASLWLRIVADGGGIAEYHAEIMGMIPPVTAI